MSDFFSSTSAPPQLDIFLRERPSAAMVNQGFSALGYHSASVGYRAIIAPVTPLDKSFQIYALVLIALTKFGPESNDHDVQWAMREQAWGMAADWLMANEEPFLSTVTKKQYRSVKKELMEALRVQCSHELPPGTFTMFPRDGKTQSKSLGLLTDTLQGLGLNRKIQAAALGEGAGTQWTYPPVPLRDYGTLDAIMLAVPEMAAESFEVS